MNCIISYLAVSKWLSLDQFTFRESLKCHRLKQSEPAAHCQVQQIEILALQGLFANTERSCIPLSPTSQSYQLHVLYGWRNFFIEVLTVEHDSSVCDTFILRLFHRRNFNLFPFMHKIWDLWFLLHENPRHSRKFWQFSCVMSVPYVSVSAAYTFSTEDDSPPEHSCTEKNGYSQGTKKELKISFSPCPAAGLFCAHMVCTATWQGFLMWHVAVVDITDCDMLSH